jgi:hypothetical protein
MNVSGIQALLMGGLIFGLLSGCSKNQDQLFEQLSSHHTGIDFVNQLYEDENLNIITFEYFYNGAGVGIIDINNDGLQDIFFSGNMVSNRLYLNKGDMRFEDITPSAGLKTMGKWANGVSVVDINHDGWMDIYVCYSGPFQNPRQRENELYINNHNNTFTEQAVKYGLADTGHSVQAAFFDYDRDGDLDVYILTNTTDETGPNIIRQKRLHGEMNNTDKLYRNNGDNTFSDVSSLAGITIEGYGLGVSICDLNSDGWPDVFVSNDYLSNDILYINQRDGTFIDQSAEYFKHTSYSAMGNDIADYNNDGLTDLIEVDMLPPDNKRQKLMLGATNYDRYRSEIQYGYSPQFMRNTLQLNGGLNCDSVPSFSEIGQLAGIYATDWSWSPLFADIDNDGWKDLLITNGYPRDITNRDFASYKAQEFIRDGNTRLIRQKLFKAIQSLDGAHLPCFAFRNNGDLTFSDKSTSWGFTQPMYSSGAAYGDLDNDGDLDYVTNNINSVAAVFENHANEMTENHYLRIKLQGPELNKQGHGTKLTLYYGKDRVQHLEYNPYRGYQSTVEQYLHFGLGTTERIDSLLILWPDQRHQVLRNINSNQALTLQWEEAKTLERKNNSSNNQPECETIFDRQKNPGITYRHRETEYADFKIERLLPHKYSEEGPAIAAGDINNDQLEDLFIGGAYNQSGEFFIQQKDGKFLRKVLTEEKKFEEDMGALLFDADNDDDNDLYVVSGGNEFEHGSGYYQDRLYINDGKGNFKQKKDALPILSASGSCVIACDFDKDYDLDLFVGGRLTPHQYPNAGTSYILQNDNGIFKDVTDQLAPALRDVGMVTSALWSDVDNDDEVDLILVGEWMPVTIFKNSDGKFPHKTEITNSTGWWNSIQSGDFDSDGDTDYVLGNLGLNSPYHTSPDEPVSLYVNDFNNDGVRESILSRFVQHVNRPVHPRDDLLQQMTSFKKKFPDYNSYSQASIDDLVSGVDSTLIIKAETFASSYLENKNENGWSLRPLPIEAQVAPVYGVLADDYDNDGILDMLLTGNSYATEVLTGRYDAFKGLFLHGDGHGNFKPTTTNRSNFLVDGNAKSLASLVNAKGDRMIVAAQNNDDMRVYESHSPSYKQIKLKPFDQYVTISQVSGNKRKIELHYGAGYLSQSSRYIMYKPGVDTVRITNSKGETRVIDH